MKCRAIQHRLKAQAGGQREGQVVKSLDEVEVMARATYGDASDDGAEPASALCANVNFLCVTVVPSRLRKRACFAGDVQLFESTEVSLHGVLLLRVHVLPTVRCLPPWSRNRMINV